MNSATREKCSFDAIIEKYGLTHPALLGLAKIVRVADTNKTDLAPESIGLEAIASGSMIIAKDDHETIEKHTYLYDALYGYCKGRRVNGKYASEIEKLERKQRLGFLKKSNNEPCSRWLESMLLIRDASVL